jgi:hypothetical protein
MDRLPCVLTPEQQKTAEGRLHQVVSALPAGLRGAHIATPFTTPGYMRMHDWFILAGPIGERSVGHAHVYWTQQCVYEG